MCCELVVFLCHSHQTLVENKPVMFRKSHKNTNRQVTGMLSCGKDIAQILKNCRNRAGTHSVYSEWAFGYLNILFGTERLDTGTYY